MNNILPDILQNPWKNCKILEFRPQSSKNAEKSIKFKKNHDVDQITPVFGFQRIVHFHPGASTNKHKIKF